MNNHTHTNDGAVVPRGSEKLIMTREFVHLSPYSRTDSTDAAVPEELKGAWTRHMINGFQQN